MNIKNYLFVLPFCRFILGYSIMYKIFNTCTVETPHLIGKYIHEVLPALTQYNLNLRLIEQKEDSEIPEGIIISQIPTSGSIIKPHQSIFVITTKKTVT